MTYDVLIAGAGSAGMPCAIQAAARGLRVLVLDKDTEPGGTLHLTAGHLSAAGTKRQQQRGIADTPQQHFDDIARICRNTMNPAITRKAVELAPDTLNWLEGLGYPFHDKTPLIIHGHEPYSVPRTYFGRHDVSVHINQPGKTVYHLLLPLWNRYLASGHIHFLPRHTLKAVQTNGRFITAFVAEHEGATIELTAAHYVLTTGGYAANPGFFTNNGSRLISTARHTSTGDGINVAMAAGAVFAGHEKHSSTLGGIETEPGSGRANFWGAWARVSNGVDRKQREIYVNEQGLRFMNEYDLNADERERLVLQQSGRRFWVIFDEAALTDGDCLVPQWTHEQLRAEAQKEKTVWQAGSIAALAVKAGLPPEALQTTAEQFNGFVKAQHDADFGRTYLRHPLVTPTFYAVLVYAYSLISFGGIQVNEQLQVLHKDGGAFENLYAAGEVLGAAATSGHAFCGGMLLTPALAFGKWLGEHLE
jgi:fumarate reductase flavoprotein subunit